MRRFGPIRELCFEDAEGVVHILTDHYVHISSGGSSSEQVELGIVRRSSSPGDLWLWKHPCDRRGENGCRSEAMIRMVLMATVELAGPNVRYDEDSDEIVDEREVVDHDVEAFALVWTAFEMEVALKRNGVVVGSVYGWARREESSKEESSEEWRWNVDAPCVQGLADCEDQARRRIVDAVQAWWIMVGPTVVLEDGESKSPSE